MSDTPFTILWPRQFIERTRKDRARCQGSLDSLQNQHSDYADAHRRMLTIYDAAIEAAERILP